MRAAGMLLLLLMLQCSLGTADDKPTTDSRQQAAKDAREAARKAIVRGPSSIALRDQATLALPEHFGFIPQKEATALMLVMGNPTGDSLLGLIVPLSGEGAAPGSGHWVITLRYKPEGYIKDDDARHWDADELLNSLKEGTEAGNERREREGIPPIQVTRWIEVPHYQAGNHQLRWSAEVKLKNAPDPDPTINYNTYLLGRDGFISMNLVTAASEVGRDKESVRPVLDAMAFNSGRRYTDFNSSTDRVAAYGLAALVAGVAAKKLGLLALIAAFVVKFAKVIVIASAAFGAAIIRWFKARSGSKDSAA